MAKIAVAGLINIETTLRIADFPLQYNPVNYPFGGVRSSVSGVGVNVAAALTTLGDDVHFMSLIGRDAVGQWVLQVLQGRGLDTVLVLPMIDETAQSVILYEQSTGRRQIHVDLKTLQETPYPTELAGQALAGADMAVLCNINFARPLLAQAQAAGIPIASDVHTIGQLDDDYNQDFMAAADVLFMSNEAIPTTPRQWLEDVQGRFGNAVVVMGLGQKGALMRVRDDQRLVHQPAVAPRPIVNTIGAGDALFSAFVHHYAATHDPYRALELAVVFAGYKIGERGAADGFLCASELLALADALSQTLSQTPSQ